MQQFISNLRDENGQTMAEYAVVLGVITIAVVATLTLLAGAIQGTLTNVINSLERAIPRRPARRLGPAGERMVHGARVVFSPAHERRQSGDVDHLGRDRHRDGHRARGGWAERRPG
jgi:Flp pilus assembly pilin Flp